jgi:DNA-binding transcriptional LysR family regulator
MDLRIALRKLEIFCQVVDAKGVTRAAELRGLTQPVVSGHVRSLEDRLGARLFTRTGRESTLTDAGERTYHWAQEILRANRELHRELEEMKGDSHGRVAIAASMSVGSYLLPPLLAAFAKERPGVRVKLAVCDPAKAQEMVRAGKVDLAITLGSEQAMLDGLACDVIGLEELVLVGSPDCRPGEMPLGRDEILALRFIESPVGGQREMALRRLGEVGLDRLNVVMELGHPEAVKRAVEAGAGVAFLFRGTVRDDLERGRLQELPLQSFDLAFPVQMLTCQGREMSQAQAELIDELCRQYEVSELA